MTGAELWTLGWATIGAIALIIATRRDLAAERERERMKRAARRHYRRVDSSGDLR